MAVPSSKRPRFDKETKTAESERGQGLAVMIIDVEEESSGTMLLWGVLPRGRTVLLVCPDYQPYFYIPCPYKVDTAQQNMSELQQEDLRNLRQHLNSRLPLESQLESLQVLQQRPIMYYRPEQSDGSPYVKCTLKTGAPVKKAAGVVEKLAAGGLPGFSWRQRGTEAYEAEVKPLTRFLCDASLSGGSWVWVCSTPTHRSSPQQQQQQQNMAAAAPGSSISSSRPLMCEFVPAGSGRRRSSCAVELVCSWQCLHSLTPDATQLAELDWQPQVLQQLDPVPPALHSAAAAAAAGDILPLKLLVMDVLIAPADGSNRSCNPAQDPVITISCQVVYTGSSSSSSSQANAASEDATAAAAGPTDSMHDPGSTAGSTMQQQQQQQQQQQKVAFVLASPAAVGALPPELSAEGFKLRLYPSEVALLLAWRDWVQQLDPDGIVVFQVRDNLGVLAARFAALNLDGGGCHISRALRQHSRGLSTKSVVMYSVAWVKSQSRMASTSNQETFRAQGLPGRLVLDVLRQVLTSQGLATFSLVDCCHSLLGTTLEVLPSHQLAALQQQLAVTPAAQDPANMQPPSSGAAGPGGVGAEGLAVGHGGVSEAQLPGVRAAVRLARYSLGRCWAVACLMERLASVPEVFEMARATGLTLEQVLYNAQMIRTWSLLLRTSHRRGYIVAGRTDSAALVESPYLMHPIEHKTAGLYSSPVATLDFASLYPSLYRAYNLCYTTLVHPDDVARVGTQHCTVTPTGAAFLLPSVRPGVLPHILSALMSARAATRASLKAVQKQLHQQQQGAQRGGGTPGQHHADSITQLKAKAAVLDGRQKALKLTANALYGFTGAQASPLQCAPLADSCLALGAATCRTAAAAITSALEQRQLGPKGAGGKVIYAQTDSVFIHFPSATAAEAVGLGQQAAQLVTAQLPPPIELKYERVCCPFMLLHVNRYAGCSYETAAAAESGEGQLLVKGIKAVWRQSAPLLQNTLMGALERILMQRDAPGAVSYVEGQIARLLSGRVELWELVMTGGLWRVTGQQLEKAAAAASADAGGNGNGAAAATAAAGGDEDVKGPHASLAVRLSQRDPHKKWLLGERLSYVLLTGTRTQDEAAEAPLTAAQLGLSPNYELYFTNKLQIPLKEIFSTCLNPEQMRHLLNGPHTSFRASTITAGDLGAAGIGGQQQEGSLGLAAGSSSAAAAGVGGGAGSQAAAGRGSGRGRSADGRGKGRGSGRGTAAAGTPDKNKGAGAAGRLQAQGMRAFFQQSAKCLGCKQVIRRPAVHIDIDSSGAGEQQQQQQQQVDPGLCERCEQEDGKRESVQIAVTQEASVAAVKFSKAQSACRSCHSGGQLGVVVCENGECPVVYERLSGERQLRTAQHKLLRLDVLDW